MATRIPIKINAENCRGCRRCEVACAWHGHGPLNPRLAGIQIMKLNEGGTDQPVINMECLEDFCGKTDATRGNQFEPVCVSACLFKALQIDWEGEDNE